MWKMLVLLTIERKGKEKIQSCVLQWGLNTAFYNLYTNQHIASLYLFNKITECANVILAAVST